MQSQRALPYINEFHYSNTGTDANEFVEIAINATDTNTYRIQIYNGATGKVLTTKSIHEPVTSVAGTTYMVFLTPGLQNGLEGFALVDKKNKVIEFLSYKGSFKANNGLAAGLTSIDVFVKETGNTPINYSL